MISVEVIGDLMDSYGQLSERLLSVADAQKWQPAPNEWSFQFIAGHMATVEHDCWLARIQDVIAGKFPTFTSYDNSNHDFSNLSLEQWVDVWGDWRQALFTFIYQVPPEMLVFTGTHEMYGSMDVPAILDHIKLHDEAHLAHLETMIAEYQQQANG